MMENTRPSEALEEHVNELSSVTPLSKVFARDVQTIIHEPGTLKQRILEDWVQGNLFEAIEQFALSPLGYTALLEAGRYLPATESASWHAMAISLHSIQRSKDPDIVLADTLGKINAEWLRQYGLIITRNSIPQSQQVSDLASKPVLCRIIDEGTLIGLSRPVSFYVLNVAYIQDRSPSGFYDHQMGYVSVFPNVITKQLADNSTVAMTPTGTGIKYEPHAWEYCRRVHREWPDQTMLFQKTYARTCIEEMQHARDAENLPRDLQNAKRKVIEANAILTKESPLRWEVLGKNYTPQSYPEETSWEANGILELSAQLTAAQECGVRFLLTEWMLHLGPLRRMMMVFDAKQKSTSAMAPEADDIPLSSYVPMALLGISRIAEVLNMPWRFSWQRLQWLEDPSHLDTALYVLDKLLECNEAELQRAVGCILQEDFGRTPDDVPSKKLAFVRTSAGIQS